MLNKNDDNEVLYFGGSYWPNGDIFCPLIMQAKIVDGKITGFDNFGALYIDCSLDSVDGPCLGSL